MICTEYAWIDIFFYLELQRTPKLWWYEWNCLRLLIITILIIYGLSLRLFLLLRIVVVFRFQFRTIFIRCRCESRILTMYGIYMHKWYVDATFTLTTKLWNWKWTGQKTNKERKMSASSIEGNRERAREWDRIEEGSNKLQQQQQQRHRRWTTYSQQFQSQYWTKEMSNRWDRQLYESANVKCKHVNRHRMPDFCFAVYLLLSVCVYARYAAKYNVHNTITSRYCIDSWVIWSGQ